MIRTAHVTKAKLFVILLCAALCAHAQVAFPPPERDQAFAYEDKDWGVAPTTSEKRQPVHSPTPTSIPGGRVIRTLELKALLSAHPEVVVVDVLDGSGRRTVPGAHWMSGAGSPGFYGAETSRFQAALEKLTEGDKSRPLVFVCLSSECWLSYNASLRALAAGYKDVIWYRGGTDAWRGANLDTQVPRAVAW